MNIVEEIEKATGRLEGKVLRTPLFPSTYLSSMNGGEVYLKLESEQHTGSFKARGALNKILAMRPEEKTAGLITASTGNHAQGFARALSISGDRGSIYLPTNAEPSKVEALKHYDVELEFFGSNSLETELHAKAKAAELGQVWVSPYNDPMIVAGQGTVGVEILEQLPEVDYVLACIGGGGLMSGIGAWIKSKAPHVQVIGCLPERSPEMYLSVKKGEVVLLEDPQPTLSDGSAGGLEEDSITFGLCQQYVDDYLLATEEEIAEGIRFMVNKHHKIVEGAAGVAVACYLNNLDRFKAAKVAIVICGANITTEKLKTLL